MIVNKLKLYSGEDWREFTIPPGLKVGQFLGTVLDFLIIALALYIAIRAIAQFKGCSSFGNTEQTFHTSPTSPFYI